MNGPSLEDYAQHIDDKVAAWKLAKRAEFVAKIEGEVGSQQKGSPQVNGYWRSCFGPEKSDAWVREYAKDADWCGGMILWGLHEVGLATDVFWIDSRGFVDQCDLPIIRSPKLGDICYWNEPYRHYATVVGVGPLKTVDGNQTKGVTRKTFATTPPFGDSKKGACVFFSLEPILERALA